MKPTFDLVSQRIRELFGEIKTGAVDLGEEGTQFTAVLDHISEGMNIDEQNAALMKKQVKHAIHVNLSDEWPVIMSPGQWVTRAFILASPDLTPRSPSV